MSDPICTQQSISNFKPKDDFHNFGFLVNLGVCARQEFPEDPKSAFQRYAQAFTAREGVDDGLLESLDQAWETALTKPVFFPLALETDRFPSSAYVGKWYENVHVGEPVLRLYNALIGFVNENRLDPHCFGVDLNRIADRLGYRNLDGSSNRSRALRDVKEAEKAGVLSRLFNGCKNVAGKGGVSGVFCLRGSFESITAARNVGFVGREYRKLVTKGVIVNPTVPIAEPVSSAPAVASAHEVDSTEVTGSFAEHFDVPEIDIPDAVPAFDLEPEWRYDPEPELVYAAGRTSMDHFYQERRERLAREQQEHDDSGIPF